ncbi:hypothetical protein NLU13_1924 [Sarocladium strictum]|uniref:Spindle pole body component n=1 Tax=Sarocladium strictum TaxID=5046 RepID=A0AA39GSM1_SARSR|nr:hypothetical protein NLU13_1924 [Sarocladium strictum]
MAFAASIGPLVVELVSSLSHPAAQRKGATLKARQDSAVHSLKSHTFLRTNQFEVQHAFDGLEERLRINSRDGLADALRERLHALEQTPSGLHPEILSLLLQLSDQPTFKSRLRDLDALQEPKTDPGENLTWKEIAKQDAWNDDPMLWQSIQYGDSSDDEELELEDSVASDSTALTGDDGPARNVQDLIMPPSSTGLLHSIRQAQAWRQSDTHGSRKVPVPEIQVVREVLFMLQGLPTTLFDNDAMPRPSFQMAGLAWQTHRAIMGAFAEYGRQLALVRRFAQLSSEAPHLQVFQDCVTSHLEDLDRAIATLQKRFAAPESDVTVSLIATKYELSSHLEPLSALSAILSKLLDAPNTSPFQYLEVMYQEVCMSQLSGKLHIYIFLAKIFLACFRVYLRPIRLWMDEGRLIPGDEIFFVTELDKETPLGQTWHSRFLLRHSSNGKLHAPDFLRPAAGRIFNAGKNIVVLRQLGMYTATQSHVEPSLDFESICPGDLQLAPFVELFGSAFDNWIQSKYGTTSSTLKEALFNKCELAATLNDLQRVYLSSDGSAATPFHEAIFDKLDNGTRDWHNTYVLTASAHGAFASLIDADRLKIEVNPSGQTQSSDSAQLTVKSVLPAITAKYRLAWPSQIIISEASMAHYQSLFTLLLQHSRATSSLTKHKLQSAGAMLDWTEQALYFAARNSLLWFCSTLHTYLATLVLEPNIIKLREDLEKAPNVDAMIQLHEAFAKQCVDESCLGSRLAPIRECMLDIFDLALKLERARELKQTGREMGLEPSSRSEKSYTAVLRQIKADFDRHLRFMCEGLRSVARASSDSRSAKWFILADMLHSGSQDERR